MSKGIKSNITLIERAKLPIKTYKMHKVGNTSHAEIKIPQDIIEHYAALEDVTVQEFIKEYRVTWFNNNNGDSPAIKFVKDKVEVISEAQFLKERGEQKMLWESILSKLKDDPDEIIKLECENHDKAKNKQRSLFGSMRQNRNKWYSGKITTAVSANILYIRLKDSKNESQV